VLRAARDGSEWRRRVEELKRAAAGSENVLVPLREALRARATIGETCDALRDVWGTYRPPDIS
jgi:methylmalonyl-CoA mutase, N-terminal domain